MKVILFTTIIFYNELAKLIDEAEKNGEDSPADEKYKFLQNNMDDLLQGLSRVKFFFFLFFV